MGLEKGDEKMSRLETDAMIAQAAFYALMSVTRAAMLKQPEKADATSIYIVLTEYGQTTCESREAARAVAVTMAREMGCKFVLVVSPVDLLINQRDERDRAPEVQSPVVPS